MHALTATEIVGTWERAAAGRGTDRALALLGLCRPEETWDELTSIPIGERDAALLELHRETFGEQVDAIAPCPDCGERVVFALPDVDLPLPQAPSAAEDTFQVRAHDYTLECRIPDSRDLEAIASAEDAAGARTLLIERCISVVSRPTADRSGEQVPEEVIDAAAEEMARRQPWADIEIELDCPACGCSWQSPLDVAAFVWDELAAEARRLLHEVDCLARAYGWSEDAILRMSVQRRRAYVELAT
jgi:rubredoxin